MPKHLTIREFARLANVSPATVVRAFAGSSLVATKTRRRVFRMAERHGFQPNRAAGAAFGRRSGCIGVFLPPLRVGFFADVANGIMQEFLPTHRLPILLDHTVATAIGGVRHLVEHRVDAIIFSVVDESLQQADIDLIHRHEVPMVLVDTPRAGFSCDGVITDDVRGGEIATRHLLDLGHRRIGFCYYGEGASTCDLRLEGCQRTLAGAGLALRPEHVARQPARPTRRADSLLRQVERMLALPDRPTAIFAGTDYLAMSVYEAALAAGLRIPQDLSVVGYADLEFAAWTNPPLTTVRQDGIAVGRVAGQMVLDRLSNPDAPARTITLPVELVVRASTAPPPSRR